MEQQLTLGRTVITTGASDQLCTDDVLDALCRHAQGDWGDLRPEEREENELSIREGLNVFSVYHDRNGTKFWVITEADRSATTVLMPEEY